MNGTIVKPYSGIDAIRVNSNFNNVIPFCSERRSHLCEDDQSGMVEAKRDRASELVLTIAPQSITAERLNVNNEWLNIMAQWQSLFREQVHIAHEPQSMIAEPQHIAARS